MKPVVIIVNYNSGDALPAVLRALNRQTLTPDIIVVDNASCDDSTRRGHAVSPTTRFYPLRHNTGFARAFNYGVGKITGGAETVIAVNPDTHPRPTFIEAITTALAEDRSIASVAGTLTFSTAPEIIASAGIAVHRNGVAIDARLGTSYQEGAAPAPVFGASGGAAAYRLSAFRKAGGFCEPFFMYLEDVDLAWRLRLAGWDARWCPEAVATHDYSGASGEGSAFKRRLLARNRIWTLARCLPAECWQRDRRNILTFDVAAALVALPRRDLASLRGRAEGIAGLPRRLHEGAAMRAQSSVDWSQIDAYIQPAMKPAELLRLRALTGRLAKGL